jgi:hypothetical protein
MAGKTRLVGVALLLGLALSGCRPRPHLEVMHLPVVAQSTEQVTFVATVLQTGGPSLVEIIIDGTVAHSCAGQVAGDTCTFVGGPFASAEGDVVRYSARITDGSGGSETRGPYSFGVTDSAYGWSQNYIPARVTGRHACRVDFVFHRTAGYASFVQFLSDVADKIYDVFGQQDVIQLAANHDRFNFYVYTDTATTASCGTVDSDVASDMPWRDVDAILHPAAMQDCASIAQRHFTAEGGFTKAFLHESGHAAYGLADEYDSAPACYTYYFEPANEPNIWNLEADCRTEQTARGRAPDECWEFTTCQGGWWGIQELGDGTVMQVGDVGDPWGIESREHMVWFYDGLPSCPSLGVRGVILVPVRYRAEIWMASPQDVLVLPCEAPSPVLQGIENSPVIRLMDAEGKDVYVQRLPVDPRIIQIDDADEAERLPPEQRLGDVYMLDEVQFTFSIPYVEGAEVLEFYVDPSQREPSFRVDLRAAIQGYWERGGDKLEAPCQDEAYLP